MPPASRVIVVVPTYNEAENLEPLVEAVLSQDSRIEVLVVDDDSPDGTGKLADGLAERTDRVHVLHRAAKEGLGAAYRAGLRRALDLGADVVVQMDCDFSHPPDMLPTFLERIEHCDVVIGSRYVNGITVVNWPIERILLSYFGNWYARHVTGLSVMDATGGFRCTRAELLEKMGFERIRANGYGFQIEMNYRFEQQDARIEELEFFFVDRKKGESKMSLRIAFEALWIVWWLRIAGALGRLLVAEPCRVLILNERDLRHPAAGGAELHVFEIFGRLARRGYDVTLLSESFRDASDTETIEDITVRRLSRVPAYYARAAAHCLRETRRGRYDVVVECLNKLPYFAPLYSASPVLALSHHLFGTTAFQQVSWPIAATVWAAEKLIPLVHRHQPFVAISESSRVDLVERGIDESQVRVSHCGIRHPTVPFDIERPRGSRIVYLGRLAHYKRVDVLLHAVAALRPHFPKLELVIIGRGPAQPGLEALCSELGLQDCTRFAGFISDDERDSLVGQARVCVCPSEKEGWGLTVIESNAVGTPVVAADAPGLRDSVRHDETGFLVTPGDVDGFTARIGAILDDDELALRLGRSAYEWSKHFDWDDSADEMADAIDDARDRP